MQYLFSQLLRSQKMILRGKTGYRSVLPFCQEPQGSQVRTSGKTQDEIPNICHWQMTKNPLNTQNVSPYLSHFTCSSTAFLTCQPAHAVDHDSTVKVNVPAMLFNIYLKEVPSSRCAGCLCGRRGFEQLEDGGVHPSLIFPDSFLG